MGKHGKKTTKKLLRNEDMHAPEATALIQTTRKANTMTLPLHLEHKKSPDNDRKMEKIL